jgi:hypothetical protein
MKFAYRRYRVQLPESNQLLIVYRPVIPISIRSAGLTLRRFALVDTGADFTLLPAALAEHLGVAPDRSRSASMSGVGGSSIFASPAEVEFELSRGSESYNWRTEVFFGEQDYLLLWNEGFLEFFVATFDWAEKTLQIVTSDRFQSASIET